MVVCWLLVEELTSTTNLYLIFPGKGKKYGIIILLCNHIHTQKHQIDAEEGKKLKSYDSSYINI